MRKNWFLIIGLVCFIPIVLVVAIFAFRVPFNTAFLVVLMLMCPLSHFLMMKFMPHDETHSPMHCQPASKESKPLEK